MLDQLIALVTEHAGEAIIKNPAIPDEKNEAAITATASGIFEVLKGQLAGGKTELITGMFSQSSADHPLFGQIGTAVQQQLTGKFNLSSPQAAAVVRQMIPVVMQHLVRKTNDPNDNSFTMDDILSSLGGDQGGDLLNTVKGFFDK